MKQLTLIITFLTLCSCSSIEKTKEIGEKYNIQECLEKECELGCEEDSAEEEVPASSPDLTNLIMNCNGKQILVIDKTDLGNQWLVISETGQSLYCNK